MNKAEKLLVIQQNKEAFQKILIDSDKDIDNNLDIIETNYKKHYEFLIFIESTHVINKCKWSEIKNEYNLIRKNVAKSNQIIKQVTKQYNSLTNYYNIDEINKFNSDIKYLGEKIEHLNYEYIILKNYHKETVNKIKQITNKQTAVIINKLDDDINQLLDRINTIYNEIKELNHNFTILNSKKKKISIEISTLKHNKK